MRSRPRHATFLLPFVTVPEHLCDENDKGEQTHKLTGACVFAHNYGQSAEVPYYHD